MRRRKAYDNHDTVRLHSIDDSGDTSKPPTLVRLRGAPLSAIGGFEAVALERKLRDAADVRLET